MFTLIVNFSISGSLGAVSSVGVVGAGGFSGEGVAEGAGDIGGDMRCSGLGAGAGLGDELGTTMCLGLRGLSLRMTTVFSGTAATFSLEAGAGEVGALRNPITVGTDRRGNPLGLTTPLAGAPLGVCPLRGLIPLTCPLDTRVMGMARSELGEGLEEGVTVELAGDLGVNGIIIKRNSSDHQLGFNNILTYNGFQRQ